MWYLLQAVVPCFSVVDRRTEITVWAHKVNSYPLLLLLLAYMLLSKNMG